MGGVALLWSLNKGGAGDDVTRRRHATSCDAISPRGVGGVGESGFCYEAGALVGVAPEDALGSGGWENRKTPRRSVQWRSAAHGVEADVERQIRLRETSEPKAVWLPVQRSFHSVVSLGFLLGFQNSVAYLWRIYDA